MLFNLHKFKFENRQTVLKTQCVYLIFLKYRLGQRTSEMNYLMKHVH